jgi:hypothetical protein
MNKLILLKIAVLTLGIVELASSWEYAFASNYGKALIFAGGGLATVDWFTTISPRTFKDFRTPVSVLVAREMASARKPRMFSMALAWVLILSGLAISLFGAAG